MKNIRIATAVFNARVGQNQDNLKRMTSMILSARNRGASLILFPEMSLTGYTSKKDIIKAQETIDGSHVQSLRALSSKENITILTGLAERSEQKIYATHLVITPDGNLDSYRKLHLGPPEVSVFTPGNSIPVFNSNDMTYGIQLCYDTHFPELSTKMRNMGAEVIFMAYASPRGTPLEKYESWIRYLKARAYDNSVFIVACNQTGSNGLGLMFPGLALVLDPLGNIVNKKISKSEGLLITDLKKESIDDIRNHKMKHFFPNRRNDLY